MRLEGLTIDVQRVRTVSSRAEALKATSSNGSASNGGSGAYTTVSEAVLAETRRARDQCRCEELGLLMPGMPVAKLREIGSGCTTPRYEGHGHYICPRLDRVRRRYGK
jgi:hypothetical protein